MLNSTLIEPRYDCPVCLGLPMQKLKIARMGKEIFLTLDYCKRCGGVWFDKDEVKLSQQIKSPKIRQHIHQNFSKWIVHCHECNTPMDRNQKSCAACGWENQISCPVCHKLLQRRQHEQLTLDVCHSCEGVWFDQAELFSLWSGSPAYLSHPPKHTAASQPQYSNGIVAETVGHAVVEGSLNSIAYGAEILAGPSVELVANTASSAIKGSAEVIAKAPEAAGSVVESLAEMTGSALEILTDAEMITVIFEATGEVAVGMVEVLAAAIAGIFSG